MNEGRGIWDLITGGSQPSVTVQPVVDDRTVIKLTIALSIVMIVGFVSARLTR